jgi:hypothetical protein
VLDVNGTTITSKDISDHLVSKIKNHTSKQDVDTFDNSIEDDDVVYMIPRSSAPADEISNSELLPGLFPTLFPYGCGAPLDSSRSESVSLTQHVRYLLTYDNQRFEKHHPFMFVLFNMIQRQQACWNASLMSSRPNFQSMASDPRINICS